MSFTVNLKKKLIPDHIVAVFALSGGERQEIQNGTLSCRIDICTIINPRASLG